MPDTTAPEGEAEDGVSTVFACAAVALLMAVTALAIRLGGATLARQQAETAADLGALAGASRIVQGSAAACALAREVVTVNRASMASCVTDGLDLMVEVHVPVQIWNANASAHARAGPAAAATR